MVLVCHDDLCCDMHCDSMLCYALLCHALSSYGMSRVLCFVMSCYLPGLGSLLFGGGLFLRVFLQAYNKPTFGRVIDCSALAALGTP